MITLVWVPNVSLGSFFLGAALADAMKIALFRRSLEEVEYIPGLKSYFSSEKGVRIDERNGLIESVSSDAEFIVDGVNIIGSTLMEVNGLLGGSPSEIDSGDESEDPLIVSFEDVGLQLVINENTVTSATCY